MGILARACDHGSKLCVLLVAGTLEMAPTFVFYAFTVARVMVETERAGIAYMEASECYSGEVLALVV